MSDSHNIATDQGEERLKKKQLTKEDNDGKGRKRSNSFITRRLSAKKVAIIQQHDNCLESQNI